MAVGEMALGADTAGADFVGRVSEDEGANDVADAKGDGEDTSSENEAPERQAKLLAGVRRLVKLAKDVAADDGHSNSEPGKTRLIGENWPVAVEVATNDGQFGDDEEDGNGARKEERGGIEKEPAVGRVDLDNQGPTRNSSGKKADDGKGTEYLEDDHPQHFEVFEEHGEMAEE